MPFERGRKEEEIRKEEEGRNSNEFKEEIRKWREEIREEEKALIEKLGEEEEKKNIDEYVHNIKFVTEVVFEREENESKELSKEGISKPLKDIEDLRLAIERNKLEVDVEGSAEIDPTEFGIDKKLRGEDFRISEEKVLEIRGKIIGKAFKKFGFLEIRVNPELEYKENPILLQVKVNRGEKAGFIFKNNTKTTNLVFKDGRSLRPTDVYISSLLGKHQLVVKAELTKELDFENRKDIKWGSENYGDYEIKLSARQKGALDLYMRRDYQNINPYLRTGKVPEGQEKNILDERIKEISEALAIKPIPEDIIVYRRVGQGVFGYGNTGSSATITFDKPKAFSNEKQISIEEFREQLGSEFSDKAFMSTSLSSTDVSSFQFGRFIFRINLPKGTRGAYVSELGGFKGEHEVILDKGTKLKIDRVTHYREMMANRTTITKVIIDATAIQ